MPITCHHPLKDVIFHVLFVCNPDYVRFLVEETVIGIAAEYNSDGVKSALQEMRPQDSDSLSKLQARFFMLLNEDEHMRRKVSQPQSAYVHALPPHKAERFYDDLCDNILPAWIKNEHEGCEALIDRIRESYLRA